MHRPGADEDNMMPSDFLCDCCEKPWNGDSHMIEGHKGSLVCGSCLAVAYSALALGKGDAHPAGSNLACTLCLETRNEPVWQSPIRPEAVLCSRCTKQAARALAKDRDAAWQLPT